MVEGRLGDSRWYRPSSVFAAQSWTDAVALRDLVPTPHHQRSSKYLFLNSPPPPLFLRSHSQPTRMWSAIKCCPSILGESLWSVLLRGWKQSWNKQSCHRALRFVYFFKLRILYPFDQNCYSSFSRNVRVSRLPVSLLRHEKNSCDRQCSFRASKLLGCIRRDDVTLPLRILIAASAFNLFDCAKSV